MALHEDIDHTGLPGVGGAAAQTLIASEVKGSTGAFSFTAISGSYNHLRIIIMGRMSAAAVEDFAHIKFNSDAGSNYTRQLLGGNAATVSAGEVVTPGAPGSASFLGYLAASTGVTGSAGALTVDIPCYALTTFHKTALSAFGFVHATTTHDRIGSSVVRWANTAAITQIDITGNGGSFLTGSAAYLYGIT